MRVVYLHGFASSPASRKARFFGKKFAARGVPFLAPSLDQGNFPEMTISGEVRLVQDLLSETSEPVTLIGSSLGGYVASLIAPHLDSACVERLNDSTVRGLSYCGRGLGLSESDSAGGWPG
jgi:predicted esterase YcpF (UPF0227 family)